MLNPRRGKGGASKDFVVHTNASEAFTAERSTRCFYKHHHSVLRVLCDEYSEASVREKRRERAHTHTPRAQKQTSHHNGKNDANVLVRPESNLLGVVLRRRVLTLLRDDGDLEQALDHEHEFSLGDIRVEFRFVVRMVRFLRDGVVEADDFGA